MKECTKCKKTKDLSEFGKHGTLVRQKCLDCNNYKPPEGMGFCSKCKEEKPVENFTKSSRASSGLNRWCKQCNKVYAAGRKAPRRTPAPRVRAVAKPRPKKVAKGFTPRPKSVIKKVYEQTPGYVKTLDDFNLWIQTEW